MRCIQVEYVGRHSGSRKARRQRRFKTWLVAIWRIFRVHTSKGEGGDAVAKVNNMTRADIVGGGSMEA